MLPNSRTEDTHAEVCAVIEGGFEKLKEWLDTRLKHQEARVEDICLRAIDVQPSLSSPARTIGSAADGCARPCSNVDTTVSHVWSGEDDLLDRLQTHGLEEDQALRVQASCAMEVSGFTPDHEWQDVPLPGSANEDPVAGTCAPSPPVSASSPRGVVDLTEDLKTIHRGDEEVHEAPFLDQDWHAKLMDVFDQMDLDRSGSIDRQEFAEAFNEVGLPPVHAFEVFATMDKSDNGVVDRIEWLHVIEEAARSSDQDVNLLLSFLEQLGTRQKLKGHIYASNRRRRLCFILRHDSPIRMVWDVLMMALLFYISVTMPFSLGFGQDKLLDKIDRVFDFLFCFDVLLNFRTTFADTDESIIVDGRKIACKYAKSWFLLDFMSSVPFDMITAGLLPSLTPARFLKIGKIAKVMKLLRISKMLKVFAGSELGDKLEEKSTSKSNQNMARFLKLSFCTFVLAHWLACFGTAIDGSYIDDYFASRVQDPTRIQKYVAAMYWAMMTLSTVGFGDIIPVTDIERVYSMFAMIAGGAFYGYIIGSVTSIVGDMDRNKRAYYDRMDLIQSWLDSHQELPKILRRRVRKHFKLTLSAKSVIDDSSIVSELSPELRADTAYFIIHERVRFNPIFTDIPNSALANLVEVLQKNRTNKDEFIVKAGDPGIAMYTLVSGVARYDKGFPWDVRTTENQPKRFKQIIEGDSFGEEIIFGLAETYTYSIVAITDCMFHSISEDGFKDRFRNLPDLRAKMYANFLKSRDLNEEDVKEEGDVVEKATRRSNVLSSAPRSDVKTAAKAGGTYRKR